MVSLAGIAKGTAHGVATGTSKVVHADLAAPAKRVRGSVSARRAARKARKTQEKVVEALQNPESTDIVFASPEAFQAFLAEQGVELVPAEEVDSEVTFAS